MLGGIRLRAALMSEIVDDPVCRPVITCFPRSESSNINDLLLISLPRACEQYQRILWIEILGASLLGTGCEEAVHAILDLMYAKAPYTVMQRAMHIHPTVSELLPTILGDLKPVG